MGDTAQWEATGGRSPPVSVIRIDSTEAKIGRSMKKWEIMPVLPRTGVPLPDVNRVVCASLPAGDRPVLGGLVERRHGNLLGDDDRS